MRVFLDTNIVMEFLTQRIHYVAVRKIMRAAQLGLLEACISTISLSTIAYLLGLRLKQKNIHEPEKRNVIRRLLFELEKYIQIVDISHDQTAIALKDEDFKDIEDSFQYYCAWENDCDYIVTINLKDFPACDTIIICSPEDFAKAQIEE